MKKIKTLVQAEAALSAYIPQATAYTGDDMSLVRMVPLLQAVGDPHRNLRTIHLAGTSGKTSTAYYIAALLKSSGKRVGLTVSPHVDSITERLQIDGKSIAEEQFCSYLGEFLDRVRAQDLNPSYFELLIAFVFWVAAKQELDYLVVETGLGGLLDATNVLEREDKVCVITDIGLDHTQILGRTLSAIAAQKAGIIHRGNKTFVYGQSPEVMESLFSRAKDETSEIRVLDEELLRGETGLDLSNLAPFQIRNWLLAEAVCKYVGLRDGFEIRSLNPSEVIVPGRIEQRCLSDGSLLVMDGAHNQQKMAAFVSGFRTLFPDKQAVVMLALKQGKDYRSVITELKPIAKRLFLTTFDMAQDLPITSHNPSELLPACKEVGLPAEVIDDNREALDRLLSSEADIKIITGSFYLLSQVRQHL